MLRIKATKDYGEVQKNNYYFVGGVYADKKTLGLMDENKEMIGHKVPIAVFNETYEDIMNLVLRG